MHCEVLCTSELLMAKERPRKWNKKKRVKDTTVRKQERKRIEYHTRRLHKTPSHCLHHRLLQNLASGDRCTPTPCRAAFLSKFLWKRQKIPTNHISQSWTLVINGLRRARAVNAEKVPIWKYNTFNSSKRITTSPSVSVWTLCIETNTYLRTFKLSRTLSEEQYQRNWGRTTKNTFNGAHHRHHVSPFCLYRSTSECNHKTWLEKYFAHEELMMRMARWNSILTIIRVITNGKAEIKNKNSWKVIQRNIPSSEPITTSPSSSVCIEGPTHATAIGISTLALGVGWAFGRFLLRGTSTLTLEIVGWACGAKHGQAHACAWDGYKEKCSIRSQ